MNCFLFQPVKSLVSKETILKLLNIDFMKVNGDDCNSSIMDDFFKMMIFDNHDQHS